MALLPDISPDSKPCIWPLARYQASFSEWVTNLHAEKIAIGKVEQYLLPLLDSTRNKEAIKQELLSLWPVIEQKDKASEESHSLEQLPSAKELMNEFDAFFEQTMTHCHKNGLLVAQ
jgi:methyltransferase-like protein